MKTALIRLTALLSVAVSIAPPLAAAHGSSVLWDKLVRPQYAQNFAVICQNQSGHFSQIPYWPNPTYWVEVKCTR